MPNAKVLIRKSFKPLTKEKKLEVWNKVKARIATGEYCEITKDEYFAITLSNEIRRLQKVQDLCFDFQVSFSKLIPKVIIHKGNC